jgi:drug/metabolite transporter (DMT)-like permease
MKIKVWTALISIYIIWGSTYLAIRFAVETIPPFLMAGIRFLVAGAILYIWRRIFIKDAPAMRIHWRSAAVVGLLLLVGGNGGVVWAETRGVPSSIVALIVGSTPLWMVLLEVIWPKQRVIPKPGVIIGVLLGFGGILLLIGPSLLSNSGQKMDVAGLLAVLLAAFFWSVGSLFSRKAPLPGSPLLGTGMEMLVGGAVLMILGSITGEWTQMGHISTRSLWGLIYLIIFGALIGFTAYTWLLRVAPISLVSTYAYVNPVIAIILGYFLAGEELSLRILTATLIIVSAVAIINLSKTGIKKKGSENDHLNEYPLAQNSNDKVG